MEENSLNIYPQKEKKRKLSSLTECLDSNPTISKSSFTKIKKKKKREKDHNLKEKVKVKDDVDNDDNSVVNKIPNKYLKIESSSDIDSKIRKKVKTESDIQNNDDCNENHASDLSSDKYKKKKKKKHKEVETSELSFNDVTEAISAGKKQVKVESEAEIDDTVKDQEDINSYMISESNTLSIKSKKKKRKKEKTDHLNVHSNGNIVDNDVENQLQYTNSQLLVVDYSTDNIDTNIKKKKKKKHKDIKNENALLDNLSNMETEGEVKVKVQNEIINSDTKIKNKITPESFIYSSTELHVKKAKKKHKHLEYDEIDYHVNDSGNKPGKVQKEEIQDQSNIDVENRKISKKNKHKKEIKNEAVKIDSSLEEINYIQESNNLESSQKVKSKKKKHSDSSEIDVVKEDKKNTELIESQQKKKKKKKHSEELLQEESESVHVDLYDVTSDQHKTNENHSDSYNYKKKKKKHKRQKEAIEIEDETDCDSPKTKFKKKEVINQEESFRKDETFKQPEESSGFESEEGDYSESERIPRVSKPKPSIYTKYPKLARIMQDSDSDDNYPHLQHRKLTLSEALKLSELEIKLRHEPLPQHQIEKYPGTRTLTLEEKKNFMEYCELRSGRFDSEEDQRIVHNWKKFCKTHEWKRSIIYPFLHETRKGFFYVASVEGRKKFVQFLAKGLPHRSLYSVYSRFRNLYATHKTTRYTKEEDEVIQNELKDSSGRNRFSIIARKLNRTRASVWRRYKLLLSKRKESSDDEDTITNESTAIQIEENIKK